MDLLDRAIERFADAVQSGQLPHPAYRHEAHQWVSSALYPAYADNILELTRTARGSHFRLPLHTPLTIMARLDALPADPHDPYAALNRALVVHAEHLVSSSGAIHHAPSHDAVAGHWLAMVVKHPGNIYAVRQLGRAFYDRAMSLTAMPPRAGRHPRDTHRIDLDLIFASICARHVLTDHYSAPAQYRLCRAFDLRASLYQTIDPEKARAFRLEAERPLHARAHAHPGCANTVDYMASAHAQAPYEHNVPVHDPDPSTPLSSALSIMGSHVAFPAGFQAAIVPQGLHHLAHA
jgi:hypothetical protein